MPQIAHVTVPGGVPEFAINPGDARDKAIGFDCAEHSPGFGIDLIDLAVAILADPERPFGPGQARIPAIAGRRDRAKHVTGFGVDFSDRGFGDLEKMRPVEGRSRIRGDSERARDLPAVGIKRVQPVAGGEPDPLAVEADPVHALDFGKRAVFAKNFGGGRFHDRILPAWQR